MKKNRDDRLKAKGDLEKEERTEEGGEGGKGRSGRMRRERQREGGKVQTDFEKEEEEGMR